MHDLSIVILNYNTKDITLRTLKSIQDSELKKYTVEVILVDNASTDDSVQAFKEVKSQIQSNKHIVQYKVIDNPKNLGFSGGNNRGIRQAKGKYILLLNSDVLLNSDTLAKTITFMDKHPEFAATTIKLLMPKDPTHYDFNNPPSQSNLKLDPACHRGFPTPWASFIYFAKLEMILPKTTIFGQYHQGWKDLNKTHSVDAISGAYFFARREVFDTIGLLDEGFFMYAEDLDMCMRIAEAGQLISFYPKATAIHLKGVSGRNKHSHKKVKKATNKHFWETMKLFYKKHYADKYPKPLMWIIFKAIDLKAK